MQIKDTKNGISDTSLFFTFVRKPYDMINQQLQTCQSMPLPLVSGNSGPGERVLKPYYDCDGIMIKAKGKPGPKKGYKQSPEHIEKRKRMGADHHHWAGDNASIKTGRTRALRTFPTKPCELCGDATNVDRHHIDGNTLNNSEANIVFLCRRCHMAKDGRLENFIELAKRNQPVAISLRWKDKALLRGTGDSDI
jgi:hypothetical protein